MNPNPHLRLGNLKGEDEETMRHDFFNHKTFSWDELHAKSLKAPYIPPISSAFDTSNFDEYPEDDIIEPYYQDGSVDHFALF